MADVSLGHSSTSIDIASTTITCRQSLERCTSIRSLNNDRWAENRLADFNVWDSGLGASSSRRASLEDRLALKTHVRIAVLNLLILYHNAIEVVIDLGLLHDEREYSTWNCGHTQATNPQTEPQTAQSHNADEELTLDDSTLPEAIETADVVLNDLVRLAALIRKAGTTSRLVRADATFDPRMQKHQKLRKHLYQILLCQPSTLEDRRHAHWDSIDPSVTDIPIEERDNYWDRVEQETVDVSSFAYEITEIQERLVVANLRRSHRFAYSQRHGSKLEYSSGQFEPAINLRSQAQTGLSAASLDPNMPSGPKLGTPNEPKQTYDDGKETLESSTENLTDTVASEVETVVVQDIAKPSTPSQQAVTEISTTGSRLRYPKPPRCKSGLALFTCPCCCVRLPTIFADSRRWRKHLKEDLLPYTCVLKGCPKPTTLFAEKSAWLDHMFNDHVAVTSWVCDICGETDTTESGFIEHLRGAHHEAIAADQVKLFAQMCYKRTVEEISTCPLCSWAQDAREPISPELLLDHVAEHIHEFSLRSLPWAPNRSEENPKTFAYACAKVEQWWAASFPDQEGSGYVPNMPIWQDNQDSNIYFLTHEYFAESSGPSSLATASSDVGTRSDGSDDSIETFDKAENHISVLDTNVDRGISKLCAVCHRMLSNWEEYEMNEDHKFPHHENPSDLQKSASEFGCALCYQFHKGSRNETPAPETGLHGQVSVHTLNEGLVKQSSTGKEFSLSLIFTHQHTNPDSKLQQNMVHSTIKMLPAAHKRSYSPSTNTRDSLDLAAKWLNDCLLSHPKCNQQLNDKSLPTRLIAIDKTMIRLCNSKDVPKESQYATLSHFWGVDTGMRLLKLTASSLQIMYQGIPLDHLPRTFKDAIDVAQRMDVSYLWVDSLCIVQDSREDWSHEASCMPAVFRGSRLNIAATSANDSSEGCFFDRPEHFACQADIHMKDHVSTFDLVPEGYISQTLRQGPLLDRAWILQERLLSPRSLHFTKSELYWECNQFTASETFPDGIPRTLTKADTLKKKPLDQTMWSWIVQEFTRCNLPYEKDRVFAISGIAQEIQNKSGDKYVAGMWEPNLAIQLCWFIDDTAQKWTRTNIAPSWSWLSTTGRVSYPRSDPSYTSGNEEVWISVVHWRFKSSRQVMFRELVAGTLILTCKLLLYVELEPDGMFFSESKKKLECSIYLDTPSQPSHELRALSILSHQDGSLIQGLLLEPVDGMPNTYQRLGLFRCCGHDALYRFEEAASRSLDKTHNPQMQIWLI